MLAGSPISGSIVALITPMHEDGSLDWSSLEALIEWHIQSGTSAIVAVGTTGESATLHNDEHWQVIKYIVGRVAGRVPVIAGTGANSTSEAIEHTEAAKRLGADACLSVTPYYNKPTQNGLFLHHKAIAEAVDIPNILYNVPGRTAVDMLPETTARLADVPNIVAIKDATGDLSRGQELIRLCGDRLAIYSGDDVTAIELMLMGAVGNISVTANVAPENMSKLCSLAQRAAAANNQGEMNQQMAEQARKLNQLLAPLHQDLFVEANPIPVKWALHRMGKIGTGIRLPLTPLDHAYRERIDKVLVATGVQA